MTGITTWNKPDEIIDTQYGKITVRAWLLKEQKRIMANPMRKPEVHEQGGKYCLVDTAFKRRSDLGRAYGIDQYSDRCRKNKFA